MPLSSRQLRNFWSKVHKSRECSCWLWNAGTVRGDYGEFRVGHQMMRANRVSWYIEHEVWPELNVLHTCDVPRCVNPKHLFLGTHKDNSEDAVAKGRNAKGESHGQATLSNAEVVQVKFLRSLGWTCVMVGTKFGISHEHVSNICNGKRRI